MSLKQIINTLEKNPKKLFLIDGIGALVSAFLLGVVLVKLQLLFGIPSGKLYFLAVFPLVFAGYDCFAYLQARQKQAKLLKGIAMCNLVYCFISLGALLTHLEMITILGWTYILSEILVVSSLALVEFNIAQKLLSWMRCDFKLQIISGK